MRGRGRKKEVEANGKKKLALALIPIPAARVSDPFRRRARRPLLALVRQLEVQCRAGVDSEPWASSAGANELLSKQNQGRRRVDNQFAAASSVRLRSKKNETTDERGRRRKNCSDFRRFQTH